MKIAVLGSYGHVGVAIGPLARNPDSMELVGACPFGPDDKLPFVDNPDLDVPVFDDFPTMLSTASPDIVGIFTPLHLIAGHARTALQAGAHVLCEKPLALSLDDLAALRRDAESSRRRVTAAFTMRQEPAFLAAKGAVVDGLIGRPLLAFAQKSYPFNQRDEYYKHRETYGGSIPWQAIHAIDFVRWISGREYARAAAMHANLAHPTHPGMEDAGGLLLEFADGGQAVMSFDYLRPWPGGQEENRPWGDDRLRLAGTDGVIEITCAGERAVLMTPDEVRELPLPRPRSLLEEMVASIQAGQADGGLVTTADSFRVTEVALRARDAADAGQIAAV
ncbi:MAG: Gfo/Idh/MocA family protein [Phycisphaerae bacterium]